jgi:hypothetical protein|tara:strand:+ start:3128 stop:3364 length:237 start_codon:yes stop_codon:yes gene_type:complete
MTDEAEKRAHDNVGFGFFLANRCQALDAQNAMLTRAAEYALLHCEVEGCQLWPGDGPAELKCPTCRKLLAALKLEGEA